MCNIKAMNPHLECIFQLLLKKMNFLRSILESGCLGLLLQRLKPCLELFPRYLSSVLLCRHFFLQTVNGGLQWSRPFIIWRKICAILIIQEFPKEKISNVTKTDKLGIRLNHTIYWMPYLVLVCKLNYLQDFLDLFLVHEWKLALYIFLWTKAHT